MDDRFGGCVERCTFFFLNISCNKLVYLFMFMYICVLFIQYMINDVETKTATLSIREASQYIGLSESYLRQLCRERKIRHFITGGGRTIRIAIPDLDKWMVAKEVKPIN